MLQEYMTTRENDPVLTSVGSVGTTADTGKSLTRTSKNLTCSAKQDLELEDAAYLEDPARSRSSQDQLLDVG